MMFKNTHCTLWLALAGLLALSCGGKHDRAKDMATDDSVALALALAQE
jgi:hypothetical protein